MKKFIILFLIPVLFADCGKRCEDEYETCTSKDLSWLCYYGHETLIFKRNDGIYDTLTASERDFRFTQLYPALHDNIHCGKYGQSVSVTISGKHIRASLETLSFDAPRIYIDSGQIYGLGGRTPENNIVINGLSYNDIYISNNHDTSQLAALSYPKIWRIYFNKYFGLLRMDCTKGLYWEKIN
jgi:hypothetical protein